MKSDGDLRRLFQKYLPHWHWQAIESPFTSKGIPDLNGCRDGIEVWIENKATSGYRVVFQVEQIGWLLRRARAGGRVFVAVRSKRPLTRRGPATDELWLVYGKYAATLMDGGLMALGPRHCRVHIGGPKAWDWPEIERAIKKPL